MNERLDLVSKIDFAKATTGRNGVILKAACLEASQTENGLGAGGNDDNLCNYTANGVAKTATGNWSSGMRFAIPVANRAAFGNSGTLQFEIYKADFLAAINATTDTLLFMKLWDGVNTAGMPNFIASFVAAGATTGYRAETEGYGSINASGAAVALGVTSQWANTSVAPDNTSESMLFPVTANSICDVDNTHITFGMSWNPRFCDYYIGGVYAGRHHRRQCVYLPSELAFVQLYGARIRNLLLSTAPLVNPNSIPGAPRVLLCMHSFGNHVNGFGTWDSGNGYWTEVSNGTAAVPGITARETMLPCIRANSSHALNILNVSKSSQATATAKTWAEATLNTADTDRRIDRFRPHFVVLCFRTNEANTSAGVTLMKSNITAINTALCAKGIVPIWVNEQNGNLLGVATDHSVIPSGATESLYTAMGTSIAANKIALNMDIGYCDAFAVTGGASVNPIYVENNAGAIHNNLVAGPVYGALIAAEIDRLLASPPAYAWWK